jgi:hypothetical protein
MGRAGFEDTDLDIWYLGEASSHAQSCRPSADDYKVVLMLEEVINRAQCREICFSHNKKVSNKVVNKSYVKEM